MPALSTTKPKRRRKAGKKAKRSQDASPEFSKTMRSKPMTAFRRYLEAQLANTV